MLDASIKHPVSVISNIIKLKYFLDSFIDCRNAKNAKKRFIYSLSVKNAEAIKTIKIDKNIEDVFYSCFYLSQKNLARKTLQALKLKLPQPYSQPLANEPRIYLMQNG